MEASWLWNRQAALREGQLQVIPTRIVLGIFSLLCAAIFFMAGLMADGVLYALLGLAATAVAQPLMYKILTQTTHQRRAIKPRSRVGLIVQGLIFLFFTFLLGYGVAPGHVNLLVLILGYLVSAGAAIVVSYWVCIPAPQKPEETERNADTQMIRRYINVTDVRPDGTLVKPEGTLNPDGTLLRADGTQVKPDDTIINPDGSVVPAAQAAEMAEEAEEANEMEY